MKFWKEKYNVCRKRNFRDEKHREELKPLFHEVVETIIIAYEQDYVNIVTSGKIRELCNIHHLEHYVEVIVICIFSIKNYISYLRFKLISGSKYPPDNRNTNYQEK